MKQVTTKDNSITFHSDKYNETYHSTSGAKEEAIKKFAEPCKINTYKKVTILDICFGLGYNSAAALDMFKGDKIEIIALENDNNIINQIQHLDAPFDSYGFIHLLTEDEELLIDVKRHIHLKLIIDDARKAITLLPDNHFDVIFLDPFSPKKCPELWTEEFFKEIYRVSKSGARLATYSCARSVRDNLKVVGFIVSDGPCVGRKAPGTIAIKE